MACDCDNNDINDPTANNPNDPKPAIISMYSSSNSSSNESNSNSNSNSDSIKNKDKNKNKNDNDNNGNSNDNNSNKKSIPLSQLSSIYDDNNNLIHPCPKSFSDSDGQDRLYEFNYANYVKHGKKKKKKNKKRYNVIRNNKVNRNNKQLNQRISKLENLVEKVIPILENIQKQQQKAQIKKNKNKNKDKQEMDEDEDVDISDKIQIQTKPKPNRNKNTNKQMKTKHDDVNNNTNNNSTNNSTNSPTPSMITNTNINPEIDNVDNHDNDDIISKLIIEIKALISIDLMDYIHEHMNQYNNIKKSNDDTIDKEAIIKAKKRNLYEIKNNVISEYNYVPKIPQQMLSQAINNEIYATDNIADNNNINNQQMRDEALSQIDNTIQKWESKFINADKNAVNSLLSHVMDPIENEHNKDKVNKINKLLAELFHIQENGKIKLDLKNINNLPASSIISINKTNMDMIYNDICNILLYDATKDELEQNPNNRIKNGTQIIPFNLPKLNQSHIDRIHKTIGNCNNRFLLKTDNVLEMIKFGILLVISVKHSDRLLHWKLCNTPFIQLLPLQCLKNTIFQLNLRLNTNSEIENIMETQQLSEFATNYCKNQNGGRNKDPYWITCRSMWTFIGTAITKARKIYVADGALYKSLYQYANGKRIIHRTNWSVQTFQVIGDIDKSVQKTLCNKANNLKRAYEKQISEDIIIAQFETTIKLYEEYQSFIKDSPELNKFCEALVNKNTTEYNANLLAMYKKVEIAIAGAIHSTATLRLDLMNLKSNMLRWYTISKHLKNTPQTKELNKILNNDIRLLNLITCGESLYPEQRKQVLMNRLLTKYKDGMITTDSMPLTKKRKLNNNKNKNTSFQQATSINDNDEQIDFEQLFQNPIFNTKYNNVNNFRIQTIKNQLLTFEKEDAKTNNNTIPFRNKNNRKRTYNQMNNPYNNKNANPNSNPNSNPTNNSYHTNKNQYFTNNNHNQTESNFRRYTQQRRNRK